MQANFLKVMVYFANEFPWFFDMYSVCGYFFFVVEKVVQMVSIPWVVILFLFGGF